MWKTHPAPDLSLVEMMSSTVKIRRIFTVDDIISAGDRSGVALSHQTLELSL